MRVFIAVLFKKSIIDSLTKIQKLLMNDGIKGDYIRSDMLHMTIHYIGKMENDDVQKMIKHLSKIKLHQFKIKTHRLDAFKKNKKKKIIYLSVQNNEDLTHCHDRVISELRHFGIDIQPYDYTPHMTLIRKAEVDLDSIPLMPVKQEEIIVDEIHVMESKRIENRLVYESLGYIKLS
jgi:2'-5' RNA ligase